MMIPLDTDCQAMNAGSSSHHPLDSAKLSACRTRSKATSSPPFRRARCSTSRTRTAFPRVSAKANEVMRALDWTVPAARVYPESAQAASRHADEVRIAFDGDAVLFSDEAERVYQKDGLDAFTRHETAHALQPLPPGPFKPL